MKYKNLIFFLLPGILIGTMGYSQQTGSRANQLFGRAYKEGDVYRYKLSLVEYHNNKLDSKVESICELRVKKDSMGAWYDEVNWLSSKTTRAKNNAVEDADAAAVKPYAVSLDPKGRMPMPKMDAYPSMTEPIEDFHTFFVAVSPMIGAYALKKPGDSLVLGQAIKADFSNGANIIKGDDCFKVTLRMIEDTKDYVKIYTGFMPGTKPCFPYILKQMNTPVIKDTANNFQEVTQTGRDSYTIQYGREMFYIISTVNKADGKIVHAELYNNLKLKSCPNCSMDYKNCSPPKPYSEQRNLVLELL